MGWKRLSMAAVGAGLAVALGCGPAEEEDVEAGPEAGPEGAVPELDSQSWGHAAFYCGHDVKWSTIDGRLHKSVFLRHINNRGGHRWKSAHFMFTGTGYTRVSDWYYFSWDCH